VKAEKLILSYLLVICTTYTYSTGFQTLISFYYVFTQGESMHFATNYSGGSVTFDPWGRKIPPKFTHLYLLTGMTMSSNISHKTALTGVLSHNNSHVICTS